MHERVLSIGGLVDEDYYPGMEILRQPLKHRRDRFESASGGDQRNNLLLLTKNDASSLTDAHATRAPPSTHEFSSE